ncbi:glycerol-3-phosphate dehydrogenase/oxidase [Oceaniserpentilla sp. 4NH20-0058]|uniref:glycerol-3-phosphate dehydrogenase/oxidase n=1 Tax=Oceaniserpentilla sp. 4NH20-0058 TaxID=3127660 RepID=UPI00310461E0
MELNRLDTRSKVIDSIKDHNEWDMVIVGGGITGVGVAREAARQGFSVLLLEQKDFAWGTSSRSSKMVHGGLRYLASGNLKLTSHSVKERERLMKEAPGLVNLLPYVWPHYKGQFPGPRVFSILLAVYDLFAGHKYRKYINKQAALSVLPGLNSTNLIGVTQFADAITDDSRLVMRVLQEAQNDGAVALNYCEVTEIINEEEQINKLQAFDQKSGEAYQIKAKVIVSATGAWADKFRQDFGQSPKIRPLRGSHLMFHNRRLPCDLSITLKHPTDGRSMFIYPWEGMTVVGTTDLDNPKVSLTEPSIQQNEVDYLLKAANGLFPDSNLQKTDIVSSFAGVRPIVSSGALSPSAEKRDHTIWDDNGVITVSGGKLTTFRLIALDVLKAASHYLKGLAYADNKQRIFNHYPINNEALNELTEQQIQRLSGFYGARLNDLCQCSKEEGWVLVPGTLTFWAQVRFSARSESVINLDDLMLRRTRIGLFLDDGGTQERNKIKQICQQELMWSDDEFAEQWQRYCDIWKAYYYLP